MMLNIVDVIRESESRCPGKTALVHEDGSLTYGGLLCRIGERAHALRSAGIRAGDRICVLLDKNIETVVIYFSIVQLGAICVPINFLYKSLHVRHIVSDSGAVALVTTGQKWEDLVASGSLPDTLQLVALVGANVQNKSEERPGEIIIWRDFITSSDQLINRGGAVNTDLPIITSDPAFILYTSGSTGLPKGVIVSHGNLLAGASSVNAYLGNFGHDVIAAILPLTFDAGLSQLTTGFMVGATVVLINYLLPNSVSSICERHGVTAMTAVPALWSQVAGANWTSAAAERLRYFANTGGELHVNVLRQLTALFKNAKPYLMYGLTEAFRSTYLDPHEIHSRPGSIGKAIPGARILVLREDGSECPAGEVGELVHIGPTVTLGYWRQPELNAIRFRPAPLLASGAISNAPAVWSGDYVYRDKEGFLHFVGRRDQLIKTSGYRVSPTEVEEVAAASGLISEICAFGYPDADLGESIAVAYVPAKGQPSSEQKLAQFYRNALPSYMVPKIYMVMTTMPLNMNGKYDRTRLIEAVAETQRESVK